MNWDLFLFHKINNFAGQYLWLDIIAIFFGEYMGYILVVFLALLCFKNFRRYFSFFLFALLTAIFTRFFIVEIIRHFYFRSRPFFTNQGKLLLDFLNQPSFPSGHASFFFALSSFVFLEDRKMGAVFFVFSSLLSFFRVFCGIHWPLDIVGGVLIGTICGFLGGKLFGKFKTEKKLVKIK